MTKANVPPNVPYIHTYTLRTLLHVYRRTDDGKKRVYTMFVLTYSVHFLFIQTESFLTQFLETQSIKSHFVCLK